MARETKVGLLAGLAFIVCFAVILTNSGQRTAFRPSQQVVDAVHRSADPPTRSRPAPTGSRPRPTAPDRMRSQSFRPPREQSRPSRRPGVVDGDAVLEDWGRPERAERNGESQRSARGVRRPRRTDQSRSSTSRATGPYGRYRSAAPGERDSFAPASTSLSSRKPVTTAPAVDIPGMETSPTGVYGVRAVPLPSSGEQSSNHPVRRQTVGGPVITPPAAPSRVPTSAAPRGRARLARYTVAPGDTLSRIAAKHYGRASRKNIDAIVKANRLTIANPDVLRAGVEIVLPAWGGTPSSPSKSESRRPVSHRPGLFRWYQIRPNDRYISIAREQLGDASRWREIHELNRDKFPDPGKIRTGVRIKLPLDQSASAGGRR